MKKFLLPVSLFTVLICASCASIVSKSIYNVRLASSPSEATVQVFDKMGREIFNGTTPTQVELKSGAGYFKKAEYIIKYSKEGYLTKEVTISADINGWYFGNIVFGGLIGFLIVDPATGAMYRLDRTDLNETLAPQTEKSTGATGNPGIPATARESKAGEKSLHIIELQQVPEHMRKNLVMIQ
ncbi:MAG TPA: hypothetical protein VD993_04325 [Chitinophagaceae bacterium]|nr:hypothetical protein [Chitinophagaceae bacterium]